MSRPGTLILLLALSLLGASQVVSGSCWYRAEYCQVDTEEGLSINTNLTREEQITECYNKCQDNGDCKEFTFISTESKCHLFTEPCTRNFDDPCIFQMCCVSGPANCSQSPVTDCPKIVVHSPQHLRWQCTDGNGNKMDPYNTEVPAGSICYLRCNSWTTEDMTAGHLTSSCLTDGTWTPTKPNRGTTLSFPAGPYPKPDDPAPLTCDCQDLVLKWPIQDGTSYDPNDEAAAYFICEKDITMTDGQYSITTNNTCVLYCDRSYVATAKCVNGIWTGLPNYGFWCYEEPTKHDVDDDK